MIREVQVDDGLSLPLKNLAGDSLHTSLAARRRSSPLVIYSHEHTDHIGAANLLPKNAIYIAQRETAAILARRKDPRRPVPSVTFDKSYVLTVGNQTLFLDYKGVNHELGNIFIYAPRQKVLMLVDVVYPGWMPYKNLGIAEDVPGYIQAQRDALSYDFDILVAGHVSHLGMRPETSTNTNRGGDFPSKLIVCADQYPSRIEIDAVRLLRAELCERRYLRRS